MYCIHVIYQISSSELEILASHQNLVEQNPIFWYNFWVQWINANTFNSPYFKLCGRVNLWWFNTQDKLKTDKFILPKFSLLGFSLYSYCIEICSSSTLYCFNKMAKFHTNVFSCTHMDHPIWYAQTCINNHMHTRHVWVYTGCIWCIKEGHTVKVWLQLFDICIVTCTHSVLQYY